MVIFQRLATSGGLPNIATFSKDVCIAILQNSGIRSFFYTIVRPGRMPPMDRKTIGGISTGLPPYSGLVCVPPYSQNAWDTSTYVTAWRPLAYHVSQLPYSYLRKCPPKRQSTGETMPCHWFVRRIGFSPDETQSQSLSPCVWRIRTIYVRRLYSSYSSISAIY